MLKYLPGVKKIAVVRPNGIGDYVFCIPALQALKATYPEAELVLLGKQWHAEFLKDRPGPVDRVVAVPKVKGVGALNEEEDSPEKIDEFFRKMQQENFDIALQMYGGGRFSNPFTKRLGAGLTAGMKTPESCELDRWIPYIYYQPEILRYLEVASLAGAYPCSVEPVIGLTDEDKILGEKALNGLDEPVVVINPGASDPRRRWPSEKFAAAADILAENGANIVITGSDGDKPLAQEVCGLMKNRALDISGATTLKSLSGVLAKSSMVISNDTGPLHLARAVGVPTVAVYWVGNVITAGAATAAKNRIHISWRLNCPVCGKNCIENECRHQESFVAEIPVEDVVSSALEFFSAGVVKA